MHIIVYILHNVPSYRVSFSFFHIPLNNASQESSMNVPPKKLRKAIAMVVTTLLLGMASMPVHAQQAQAPPNSQSEVIRLRGIIESVQGGAMVLKGRDGDTLYLDVPENIRIQEMFAIEFTDIKPGAIVGCTSFPQTNGSMMALEIHMFPEGSGGPPEGQRISDLQESSILTNGHVLSLITAEHKRQITLSSRNEEVTIIVPDDTPVVTYRSGDLSLLKPDAKVYLHATQTGENRYKLSSATVGADGLMPPL